MNASALNVFDSSQIHHTVMMMAIAFVFQAHSVIYFPFDDHRKNCCYNNFFSVKVNIIPDSEYPSQEKCTFIKSTNIGHIGKKKVLLVALPTKALETFRFHQSPNDDDDDDRRTKYAAEPGVSTRVGMHLGRQKNALKMCIIANETSNHYQNIVKLNILTICVSYNNNNNNRISVVEATGCFFVDDKAIAT